MTDYNNSVIYKLYCKDDNIDDFYIGSTINIKNRISCHKSYSKSKKKQLKLYDFINNNGGFNNFEFEIIEKINCDNKLDLHKREKHYIKTLKPSLNTSIPSRNRKEYDIEYYEKNKYKIKEVHKKYRQKNKDKIKEYRQNNKDKRKEYYEKNKYKIKEYNKEYIEKNKDKIKEREKKYRQNNKDKMKEYNKEYYNKNKDKMNEKIKCVCGCMISKRHISTHMKTKKHMILIKNKKIDFYIHKEI